MKFWLTFIQLLPTVNVEEISLTENYKLENKINTQETIIAQAVSPTIGQVGVANISGLILFPALIGGLVILLIIAVWAYTRVYVITPTNEAFVRTGGVINKNKKVILNGGCVILPGFHELTRVPLREISIDVIRQGALAVRTQDYLRANMRVTFYVCINAQEEDVLKSAARLSKQGKISESDIKEAIEKRADDAIRAAAKKKKLAEIDSDKLGFADEVLNLIQQDLKKVGLTLNNIAISEIEESDTYDENNFFDAQGVKLRTETIQKSIKQKLDVELTTLQEKKELELNTKVKIEQQELDAEKQTLQINKQKEDAKLTQQQEIELLRLSQQQQIESQKAQREREIQETKDLETAKIARNKILQDKAVEEEKIQTNIALEEQNKQLKIAKTLQQQEAELAEITREKTLEEGKIQKQLALQQSKIDADIALEEKNKKLKIAKTVQEQEAQVAEINRQKTVDASNYKALVEVAEAERESKIAQQEAAIAIANKEKERLIIEAQKAEAQEGVATAQQIEIAEREQKLSVISAEKDAQQRRIGEENVVEIDVFRRKRQAEIARQAAELEAQSIQTLADAKRYEAIAEAEGKKALIEAENALSDANRLAELIKDIAPEILPYLPEIMKAIAPQPGVIGDAKIYSFPGLNSNGNGASAMGDINKLLLSTSGLSLINALLDEGKLGKVIKQVKTMFDSDEETKIIASENINQSKKETSSEQITNPKKQENKTSSPVSENKKPPQNSPQTPTKGDRVG